MYNLITNYYNILQLVFRMHVLYYYYYYQYYTLFLSRGKVRPDPADKLQLKAATIIPLVGLARSNQPWARCSVFVPPPPLPPAGACTLYTVRLYIAGDYYRDDHHHHDSAPAILKSYKLLLVSRSHVVKRPSLKQKFVLIYGILPPILVVLPFSVCRAALSGFIVRLQLAQSTPEISRGMPYWETSHPGN